MIYSIFKTEFGWCGIVGKQGRLVEIIPFLLTDESVYSSIASKYPDSASSPGCFEAVGNAITRYLRGVMVDFEFSLDLSHHTEFQRRVWEVTRSIPYGEIRTYGWVSKKLGSPKSFRAVGTALAQNPLPIVIPCHRVVRSNGELGGYSAAGGINLKARLLKMEGHKLDSRGRVRVRERERERL
ncbi:MAG: methylated-DNA--[protein]-cysteine S-methyltransferase [Pseudomonadota bacterium]